MIPKAKTGKVFVTMMLLVLALTLILPTVASAAPYTHSDEPWRGSWAAKGFVYGRAYNTADQPYVWMEVHSYLYERIGWSWYQCASAVNGENNKSYCFTTCRVAEVYNEFYVKGFHEWDIDGNSYEAQWTQSSHKWC
jgi:hypothetical protein